MSHRSQNLDLMLSADNSESDSGSPVLPIEVFHLIIDELAAPPSHSNTEPEPPLVDLWRTPAKLPKKPRPWLADMKACCLVSRDFASICRPYIFQGVTITPQSLNLGSSGSPLAKFLQEQRRVASFIQSAYLVLGGERTHKARMELQSNSDRTDVAQKILTTQELLPNLSELTITHLLSTCAWDEKSAPIPCLEHDCQGFTYCVLDEYRSLTSLTTISIRGHWVPMRTLLSTPHLQNLHLYDCICKEWYDAFDSDDELEARPIQEADRLRLPLKTLNVTRVTDFEPEMVYWCDKLEDLAMTQIKFKGDGDIFLHHDDKLPTLPKLNNLKIDGVEYVSYLCSHSEEEGVNALTALQSLDICVTSEDDDIASIFQHASGLKRLTVRVPPWLSSTMSINLPRCLPFCRNTLTELNMVVIHKHGFCDQETAISALNDGLMALQGENVLEALKIDLKIEYPATYRPGRRTPPFAQLRRLDVILTEDRKITFPALSKVVVSLNVEASFLGKVKGTLKEEWWQCGDKPLREPLKGLFAERDNFEFVCELKGRF
ncbi:hypothetical protein BJ165DRAFT_1512871, partial [Panaeolus papilionaceus]